MRQINQTLQRDSKTIETKLPAERIMIKRNTLVGNKKIYLLFLNV